MLRKIIFIIGFITAITGQVESATTSPDHRPWILGWSDNQKHRICLEYILEGENIKNWSELITVECYPDLQKKITLNDYEEQIKKNLLNRFPDAKWWTLDIQPNERIWQWSINGGKGEVAQTEIARVLKAQNGLYVFHYAIKQVPISPEQHARGVAIVQQILSHLYAEAN